MNKVLTLATKRSRPGFQRGFGDILRQYISPELLILHSLLLACIFMTSWAFFQGYEIFPEVAKAANEFADQVCTDKIF